ncbi:MAG: hypothetical protein ACFFE6_01660 [Candidatus Thorarchaeota archaeon]
MSTVRIELVRWIMCFTTLLAPFGVYFYSLKDSTITVSIHSILWGIMPEEVVSSGSLFLDAYIILGRGFFYGIFNIWFGIEVIRFSTDYTRKRMALISACLSMLFPFALALLSWPWLIYSSVPVYLGPIPIQLVIGLMLMKFYGSSELHEPWSEN